MTGKEEVGVRIGLTNHGSAKHASRRRGLSTKSTEKTLVRKQPQRFQQGEDRQAIMSAFVYVHFQSSMQIIQFIGARIPIP